MGDLLESTVSHLSRRFLGGDEVRRKGLEDVVTGADRESETILLRGLRSLVPCLPTDSEEAGLSAPARGNSACWVVDPLDGSQNFAFGLPLAGVAVSLVENGRVVLAGAADVFSKQILLAGTGGGARFREGVGRPERLVDGTALAGRPPVGRVSLLRGSRTGQLDRDYVDALLRLNERYSRVYETRSPVTDLFLLLRGGTDAIVGLSLTGHESLAVVHLAQRLGLGLYPCSLDAGGPWRLPDRLLLARSECVDEYMEVLKWSLAAGVP